MYNHQHICLKRLTEYLLVNKNSGKCNLSITGALLLQDCSQGRSLAKLKLQGDMLVFGPFVSAEMYTDQAHIPHLGASSSAAFGPSLEAPESLLRL